MIWRAAVVWLIQNVRFCGRWRWSMDVCQHLMHISRNRRQTFHFLNTHRAIVRAPIRNSVHAFVLFPLCERVCHMQFMLSTHTWSTRSDMNCSVRPCPSSHRRGGAGLQVRSIDCGWSYLQRICADTDDIGVGFWLLFYRRHSSCSSHTDTTHSTLYSIQFYFSSFSLSFSCVVRFDSRPFRICHSNEMCRACVCVCLKLFKC